MKKVTILIMAAGRSTRMQGTDKLLFAMGTSTVIEQSVRPFQDSARVQDIRVVTDSPEVIALLQGKAKISQFVSGGAERQNSVMNGLQGLCDDDMVLIHDGARPFLSAHALERALDLAEQGVSFILAVPVTDTIKRVRDEVIVETPPRHELYAAQTPQGFPVGTLRRAYEAVRAQGLRVTDDAQALEVIHQVVRIVPGDYANRKITTKEDLIYL